MATVVYNLESSQPTGCVSSRKGCPPAFRCPPNRELSTDWRCPVNRVSAVMKQKMEAVSLKMSLFVLCGQFKCPKNQFLLPIITPDISE